MGTLIICVLVFGAMGLAAYSIHRDRKRAKAQGGCGGSCCGCSQAGHCGQ